MGAPLAGEIAARLIAYGMPSDTPVGIAASLSRDNQEIARGELGELEKIIAPFDRSAPLIIGVGAVYANDHSAPRVPQRECRAI
jgi:uroporphyrin-III C-methyltransferase/precorrin-2 dehydrogenase/sirohydrochlorin ferrochelatase